MCSKWHWFVHSYHLQWDLTTEKIISLSLQYLMDENLNLLLPLFLISLIYPKIQFASIHKHFNMTMKKFSVTVYFSAHSRSSEKRLLSSSCLSVCLSARNNSILTGRTYVKLHTVHQNLLRKLFFFNWSHPDVLHWLLKNKISQNTSIYCQYVSCQLVSTYKVIIRPYRTILA